MKCKTKNSFIFSQHQLTQIPSSPFFIISLSDQIVLWDWINHLYFGHGIMVLLVTITWNLWDGIKLICEILKEGQYRCWCETNVLISQARWYRWRWFGELQWMGHNDYINLNIFIISILSVTKQGQQMLSEKNYLGAGTIFLPVYRSWKILFS